MAAWSHVAYKWVIGKFQCTTTGTYSETMEGNRQCNVQAVVNSHGQGSTIDQEFGMGFTTLQPWSTSLHQLSHSTRNPEQSSTGLEE